MKHKVYVLEDNKTEGLLLKLSLSGISNIEISQFPTGAELLNAVSENVPSIVISDLNLPDMHGIDVIKQIKDSAPLVRIIVVSAQKEIDMVAEIQEMGVYNYLVKSEGCLKYLRNVIDDLLKIIES